MQYLSPSIPFQQAHIAQTFKKQKKTRADIKKNSSRFCLLAKRRVRAE
jgi:hypothetical protein